MTEGNKRGANDSINQPDSCGRSALDYAAYNGQEACVKVMLEMGADPNQHRGDPTKNNSLIYAACRNKLPCAKLLIERGQDLADETLADKNIFPRNGDGSFPPIFEKAQKAIILAAKNGYPESLINLISAVRKESV